MTSGKVAEFFGIFALVVPISLQEVSVKVFLKVFVVAAILVAIKFITPIIDAHIGYVGWLVGKLFLIVGSICILGVALVAYPWAIKRGWRDRKLDIPDDK